MAEKSPSLATQAYHTIKENILNLTYPPGMFDHRQVMGDEDIGQPLLFL